MPASRTPAQRANAQRDRRIIRDAERYRSSGVSVPPALAAAERAALERVQGQVQVPQPTTVFGRDVEWINSTTAYLRAGEWGSNLPRPAEPAPAVVAPAELVVEIEQPSVDIGALGGPVAGGLYRTIDDSFAEAARVMDDSFAEAARAMDASEYGFSIREREPIEFVSVEAAGSPSGHGPEVDIPVGGCLCTRCSAARDSSGTIPAPGSAFSAFNYFQANPNAPGAPTGNRYRVNIQPLPYQQEIARLVDEAVARDLPLPALTVAPPMSFADLPFVTRRDADGREHIYRHPESTPDQRVGASMLYRSTSGDRVERYVVRGASGWERERVNTEDLDYPLSSPSRHRVGYRYRDSNDGPIVRYVSEGGNWRADDAWTLMLPVRNEVYFPRSIASERSDLPPCEYRHNLTPDGACDLTYVTDEAGVFRLMSVNEIHRPGWLPAQEEEEEERLPQPSGLPVVDLARFPLQRLAPLDQGARPLEPTRELVPRPLMARTSRDLRSSIVVRAHSTNSSGDGETFAINRQLVADQKDLHASSMTRIDLRSVVFFRCNLRGVRFDASDLRGAQFIRCDLRGANFTGALMEGATFEACPTNERTYWHDGARGPRYGLSAAPLTSEQRQSITPFNSAGLSYIWDAPWGGVQAVDSRMCLTCNESLRICSCPTDAEVSGENNRQRQSYADRHYDGSVNLYSYRTDVLQCLPWPFENKKNALVFGVELEMEPKQNSRAAQINLSTRLGGPRGGKFICKHDGSLTSGVELVTLPYTLDQHQGKFGWKDLLNKEIHATAKSGMNTTNCGMHVHINKAALSALTIGKMLVFTNSDKTKGLIEHIAQRENSHYAVRSEKKLAHGKYVGSDIGRGRYDILNVGPSTVEVRMFRGNLRAERVLKNIEFCHALVSFCRGASMADVEERRVFSDWLIERRGTYPNLVKFLRDKRVREFVRLARNSDATYSPPIDEL